MKKPITYQENKPYATTTLYNVHNVRKRICTEADILGTIYFIR